MFISSHHDFLKVFLNHIAYEKTMYNYMQNVIFQEIRRHTHYEKSIDDENHFLYFIRIRKEQGNIFKIGITHNRLSKRIEQINNNDFHGVQYRIIIIGCMAIQGQSAETKIKQILKTELANKYEREKRNGTLSTESYRVSCIVYYALKNIFEQQDIATTFWSEKYKIDNNDIESYYDTYLGKNDIFMEE